MRAGPGAHTGYALLGALVMAGWLATGATRVARTRIDQSYEPRIGNTSR